MKEFHVAFPVDKSIAMQARFEPLFSRLDRRSATVHLLYSLVGAVDTPDADIQLQALRLNRILKTEMLNRMAQCFNGQFPNLQFELHVDAIPVSTMLEKLGQQVALQCCIVDQTEFIADESAMARDLEVYMTEQPRLPVWLVGIDTPASGSTLISVDLEERNEALNRLLIRVGQQISFESSADAVLAHSWQLTVDQFMGQCPKSESIDVARFARAERQRREENMQHYLENASRAVNSQLKIVEGPADVTIPNLCDAMDIQTLVLGLHPETKGAFGKTAAELLLKVNCDTLIVPQVSVSISTFRPVVRAANVSVERATS